MRFVSPRAVGETCTIIMSLFTCPLPDISWSPHHPRCSVDGWSHSRSNRGWEEAESCARAVGLCVELTAALAALAGVVAAGCVPLGEVHSRGGEQEIYDCQEKGVELFLLVNCP